MGLPISRSIIEAHGGQIRAENNSTLGGARFSFELPASGPNQSRKRSRRSEGGSALARRRLALPLQLPRLYPPHQIGDDAR
jgi:hypothetical protein